MSKNKSIIGHWVCVFTYFRFSNAWRARLDDSICGHIHIKPTHFYLWVMESLCDLQLSWTKQLFQKCTRRNGRKQKSLKSMIESKKQYRKKSIKQQIIIIIIAFGHQTNIEFFPSKNAKTNASLSKQINWMLSMRLEIKPRKSFLELNEKNRALLASDENMWNRKLFPHYFY